jgi:hypothetical protein
MLLAVVISLLLSTLEGQAPEREPDPEPEADCMLLQLDPQPGLARLDRSTTTDVFERCHWRAPGVVLGYRLVRPNYAVTLRIFQNNSGGIALNAVDASGHPIELRADALMDAIKIGVPLEFDGAPYRYWVLSSWVGGKPIEFEVIGLNNLTLGRETLRYAEVRTTAKRP